jgi:hypothetical protein
MWFEYLHPVLKIRGVKFIITALLERATIINIDGSIIRTGDQVLVVVCFGFLGLCSILLVILVMVHFEICLLFNFVDVGIFSHRGIFVHLSFAAWNHDEV